MIMKNLMGLALCLALGYNSFAQNEMSNIYTTEVAHSFNITGCLTSDNGFSYASNGKELTVLDNASGKVIWNKKFKEISDKLSKVDEFVPLWEANAFFVFDRKTFGADQMACIDTKTGKLLWTNETFEGVEEDNIVYMPELDAFAVATKSNLVMVKARTGEVLWITEKFKGIVGDYVYNKAEGSLLMINMKSSLIGSIFAGLKNQIVKIDGKTGNVIWEQTYRGIVEKKVITREKLVDLKVAEGKIFLYLNGIQVYDYKSGKPQWSAGFDETPDVVKNHYGAQRFGAYGVVSAPLVDGKFVYVLDMKNKRNQYIKKYELSTGKEVWTSPEIKDARAIPGMYLVNGKLVLQVGGRVEIQYIRTVKNSDGSTTTTRCIGSEQVKPMNVQCFDANSGQQIWESEKMKKGITNILVEGSNLIICSGKALYSMDIASGKENYEVKLGDDNIGLVDIILSYKDKTIVVGEKGVSSHTYKDGKLVSSSKYKKSNPYSRFGQYIYGNRMALVTEKSDIAVYNLDDCSYKMYDARKGATSYLTTEGNSLIVLESGGMLSKSKFTKLNTK